MSADGTSDGIRQSCRQLFFILLQLPRYDQRTEYEAFSHDLFTCGESMEKVHQRESGARASMIRYSMTNTKAPVELVAAVPTTQ